MEKLLIVDDEEWIVEGLRLQLPWGEYGIELTTSAYNGKEALEIIQRERPSIILSDIRMPGMDGLELAEYVCSTCQDCEFIIVSGYADFEYARKAISYGVTGYITKPIESEELEQAIDSALKKLEQKRSEKRKSTELQRVKENRLLQEKYLKENAVIGNYAEPKKYIMTVFHINLLENKKGGDNSESYFLELLRKYMAELEQTIVFRNVSETKHYIIITESDVLADYEEELKKLKEHVTRALNRIKIEMDVEGVIGISNFYENTNQSFKKYLEIRFIVENVAADKACRIVTFSEFKNIYNKIEIEHKTIRKLSNAIENGNKQEALEMIRQLSEKWSNDIYPTISIRANVQEIIINLSQILTKRGDSLYNLNCEYAGVLGEIWEIGSCEKLMELLYVLVEAAVEHVSMGKSDGKGSLVDGIKKYIDAHYAEPLNLFDVAKMFYVNPTYLSRIFKRQVGSGFNDYLRNRRLEVSAELLRDTNLKIYEVANRVGFDNPNYFMKKFQEHYGMTPSKYRGENN